MYFYALVPFWCFGVQMRIHETTIICSPGHLVEPCWQSNLFKCQRKWQPSLTEIIMSITPRWVEVACNMLRLQPTGSNRLSSIVLVTKAAYYITINIVDWLTKYSQLTYREKENNTLSRNVFLFPPMNRMDFQIKDNKRYRAVTRCTSVLRRGSHSEPHEQKRYTARQKFKDLVECLLCLCTAETRLLLS